MAIANNRQDDLFVASQTVGCEIQFRADLPHRVNCKFYPPAPSDLGLASKGILCLYRGRCCGTGGSAQMDCFSEYAARIFYKLRGGHHILLHAPGDPHKMNESWPRIVYWSTDERMESWPRIVCWSNMRHGDIRSEAGADIV